MNKVEVGQWVTVNGHESEGAARVRALLQDTPGGVRLDRKVGGFYCWSQEELSASSQSAKKAKVES